MRRSPATVSALVAVALLTAGCAVEPAPQEAQQAPPQRHDTRWVEAAGDGTEKLVYEVREFEVTADGWIADVALVNRTGATWRLTANPVYRRFGVRLFASGELADLTRRINEIGLPGLRQAVIVAPAFPETLPPGQRWAGRLTGVGPLAVGRWVRIEFAAVEVDGEPPPGLPRVTNWITDRTVQLHP